MKDAINRAAELGALMDQREVELAAALEAAESAFNETLPPLHASVCLHDMLGRNRKARLGGALILYYGDYTDGQWGFYVRGDGELVRLSTGSRKQKIMAASSLEALWHAVTCAAERQVKDLEKATASVLALLKALEVSQ